MDNTPHLPTTTHRSFDPLIEDEDEACLVRRITLTSYDDLYRLEKASVTPDDLPNSELTRFSNDFARCFGVFLFDVRLPHPTEPFLNDLRLWIKEHRHQYRCPVVLLPATATATPDAVAALAKVALVLFYRPHLPDDLASFFETMMSENAVIRCDLWDIVTATQNRGCWELVSYTGATADADQLQQAGVQLLTSFTHPTTPPAWLVSFTASAEALTKNPLRPIFRRLADNVKDGLIVCAVNKEPSCGRGFHVAVLSRMCFPNPSSPAFLISK